MHHRARHIQWFVGEYVHMIARKADSIVYVAGITCDHAIMFGIMDKVDVRGNVNGGRGRSGAITTSKHRHTHMRMRAHHKDTRARG